VFAVMSSAWVLPSIVGPAVAGYVSDRFSWRWVFLGVCVLVIPATLVMWRALPRLEGGRPATRVGRKRAALMMAVGVACLQYAGQRLDLLGAGLAAAGLGLLVPSLPRLLPAGTLRFARGLPTVIAMRGVLAGAFFGAETFVPLMLVSGRGLSTTAAGLSLTGGALGWSAGSAFQGRRSLAVPRYILVRGGCVLVAVGIAGMALVSLASVPTQLALVSWVVGGAGMGLAMPSVALLMLELSPPADQGVNSAAIQMCDALFSIVFIGIGGAVYATATRHPGPRTWAFWTIDVVMIVLALAGAWLAARVRPDRSASAAAGPVTPTLPDDRGVPGSVGGAS
jgi:MFS family permease